MHLDVHQKCVTLQKYRGIGVVPNTLKRQADVIHICMLLRYECDCQDGYEGDRCEREKNECLANPCQHGAQCEDGLARYTCICTKGFTGKIPNESEIYCNENMSMAATTSGKAKVVGMMGITQQRLFYHVSCFFLIRIDGRG